MMTKKYYQYYIKLVIGSLTLTMVTLAHAQEEHIDISGAMTLENALGETPGTIEYDTLADDFLGRKISGWFSLTKDDVTPKLWTLKGSGPDIFYLPGNIGIGTDIMSGKLTIEMASGDLTTRGLFINNNTANTNKTMLKINNQHDLTGYAAEISGRVWLPRTSLGIGFQPDFGRPVNISIPHQRLDNSNPITDGVFISSTGPVDRLLTLANSSGLALDANGKGHFTQRFGIGYGSSANFLATSEAMLAVNGTIEIGKNTCPPGVDCADDNGSIRYTTADGFEFRHQNSWASLDLDQIWDQDPSGYHTLSNIGIGDISRSEYKLSVLSDVSGGVSAITNYTGASQNLPWTVGLAGFNSSSGGFMGDVIGVIGDVSAATAGARKIGIYGNAGFNNNDGIAIYATTEGNNTALAAYLDGETHIGREARARVEIDPDDVNFGRTAPEIELYDDANNLKVQLMADLGNGPSLSFFGDTERTLFYTSSRLDIFDGTSNGAKLVLNGGEAGTPSRIELHNSTGLKTLEIHSDYEGDGESRVITDELQINGGSDLSENFDIVKTNHEVAVQPGFIVCIDPTSSGKLQISQSAYDKKVAGVISGANGVKPGMLMGQKGTIADGEYPVALAGRVYVKSNAEGGIIEPGDLLTTSNVAGEAMKVQDYQKAQGAIIGKAMTRTDDLGYVLVLVNLQ